MPLAPVLAQEAEATLPPQEPEVQGPAPETTPEQDSGVEVAPEQQSEAQTQEEQEAKEEAKADETLPEELSPIASAEEPPAPPADLGNTPKNKLIPGIDNLTGALINDYSIEVPPGRKNMTPDVSLVYNSATAGNDSIVGSGWSISIPSIERINRKGTDKLYTEGFYTSSLSGELLSIDATHYGVKTENGSFLTYEKLTNGWLVTDKTGTKYTFGLNAEARQDDPADPTKVYKWMLEETRDTNDNYISYEYFKDAGQIYPSRIVYTGNGTTDGIFEVNFLRESRANAPVSFATTFSVQSNFRISEVNTEINNAWTRKYTLTYTTGDNGAGSLLDTILESGRDESATTTTLPAVDFGYSTSATDWTYDSSLDTPLSFGGNSGDYGMRMADINGDGLLDILCQNEAPYNITCAQTSSLFFLNTGDGWIDVSGTWSFPVTEEDMSGRREAFTDPNGKDTGLRAIDVNGDLRVDLVRGKDGVGKYVYINNGSGWTYDPSWDLPYSFVTGIGLDVGLRMGDINGDGLLDAVCHNDVYSGASCMNPGVYLNNGSGWTDVSSTWLFPVKEDNPPEREYFVASGFVDAGLRLVDVNGDGLADLVRAHGSDKYTYINNGSGWTYDPNWDMPWPFILETGLDVGLRMADINSDGLVDVLCHNLSTQTGVCTKNYPQIYLNNGSGWTDVNSSWSFPAMEDDPLSTEAFLTSSYTDSRLRVLDINGDGIDDLVRGSRLDPPRDNKMKLGRG
jgi:hypothetical protein